MRAKLPTQAKSSRSAPRRKPGPSEKGEEDDVGEDVGGLGLEAEGWAMDESPDEEPGIDFPTWLGRVEELFRAEYRVSLLDYPDQPYRLGYHEGLTPEEFYQAYLARGRAF